MSTRIGFVGLGTMGTVMCQRLMGAGYPLTVWNRSEAAGAALVKAGATWAGSPKDVAAATDVVFSMVTDAAASQAVILEKLCQIFRHRSPISFRGQESGLAMLHCLNHTARGKSHYGFLHSLRFCKNHAEGFFLPRIDPDAGGGEHTRPVHPPANRLRRLST